MGLKIVLDTKDAVRAANDFEKAVGRVRQAVGLTGKAADEFQNKTSKMARRFSTTGSAAEKAGGQVDKFNRAVRSTPQVTQQATASVARLGAAARTSGGQFSTFIKAFVGIAAARKAVTTISDLESGLVTLGTVTGKTGADLNQLKNTAVEVAQATRFTPEETIGALLSLSRAGQDAAQAANSLVSVTQLAQAGVTSLGQAADLTAATIAQFASQGVDASIAASTLVATADRTKSTVLSLGASLAQAGQAAATFGVSLSETAAVAGVLQDSGVQASRAGRAIKTILAQLASAGERSEKSKESLRKLGLEIGDVLPSKTQKFTDVLRNLRSGLEGVGGEEQVNILRNLVGKDFFAVLSAAIDGIEKIDRVAKISADSVAELQDKASRQNATLAASIRGVSSAFQEILIDADEAKGGLKEFFDTLSNSIRILGGAKVGSEQLTEQVKLLSMAIKGISFVLVIQGLKSLGAALIATPFGAFVAGAAAAAVALEDIIKNSLGVTEALRSFQTELLSAAGKSDELRESFVEALGDTPQETISGAIRLLDQFANSGKNGKETLDAIASGFGRVKEESKDFLTRQIGGVGQDIVKDIAGDLSSIGRLEDAVARLGEIAKSPTLRGRALSTAIKSVVDPIKGALGETGKTLQNTPELGDLDRLFGLSPVFLRGALDKDSGKYIRVLEDFINQTRLRAQESAKRGAETLSGSLGAFVDPSVDSPGSTAQGLQPALGGGGQIDSSIAFELKKRVALAKEEQDIRRQSLALKTSVLTKDKAIASNQFLLIEEIKERIILENGVRAGDVEALAAVQALAELEAQRTRDKAEQLLLTKEQNKALKEQREIDAKKKRDAERAKKLIKDQDLRLKEAQVRASGDREGIRFFERERAAKDLTGKDREDFLSREEQIQELEREIEREQRLRDTIAGGLQSFAATLLQTGGDFKEAAGAFVQSILQSVVNNASEGLADSIGSGLASAFGAGGTTANQTGGIIPAQFGQVMSAPTVVSRGGKNYSISEGGGSTPEAVMPLMRDRNGRLGVSGGGGGSTNISMNFPNVKTTQEARNLRSTMRQQVKSVLGQQGKSRGARNKK